MVSVTEHAKDTRTGKLMNVMIESVNESNSENSATEIRRGMRAAASCGFWVASKTPYRYRRVMVQDGAKKRPKLQPDEFTAPIVRRIFELADTGRGMLDIARVLNDEGIASATGKLWSKTSVHAILSNEVYTGTLVWGTAAKDKADPVRVERAFHAIVSKTQFRRVNDLMRSRAPTITHPRRVGSSYMFSGLVRCYRCKRALSGQDSKSGKFHYYVCQSLMKRGSGGGDTPRLNARRFEELIVGRIRSSILTEGIMADLTKVFAHELDGVIRKQRVRLETIESELKDARRQMDRLWRIIETTEDVPANMDLWMNTISERRRRLEASKEEASSILSQRKVVRDDLEAIMAGALDMTEVLRESELHERRAFAETFVKEIVVMPGKAVIQYTIPISQSTQKTELFLGGRFGHNQVSSGGSAGGRATSTLIAGSIPHRWALLDG